MKPNLVHCIKELVPSGVCSFIPDLVAALPGYRHTVVCYPCGRVDPDTASMMQLSGAEVLVSWPPREGIKIDYQGNSLTFSYSYSTRTFTNHISNKSMLLPPAVSDVLFRLESFHVEDKRHPGVIVPPIPDHVPDKEWLGKFAALLPRGPDAIGMVSTIDIPYPHKTMSCSPVALRKQFLGTGILVYLPRQEPIQYGRALHEAIAMGLCAVVPRLPVFTSIFSNEDVMFFDTPEEAAVNTAMLYRSPDLRERLRNSSRPVAAGRCLRNYVAALEDLLEERYAGKARLVDAGAQAGFKRDGNVPPVLCGGNRQGRACAEPPD